MDSATQRGKIGFVSLGCPKALTDTERIVTQLRTDGYETTASYEDADVVVVNTCGFIDSAIDESLDAIAEAMQANGRVIVTGCLGAKGDIVRDTYPDVLAVTGPHAYAEVVSAVHDAVPPPRFDPYLSLVPDHGIKLTPRHYAYLKISEGCNHKCSFCIIPSMRGKLVSRRIGDILTEAESLAAAGVKELLVIAQDTSAYGVDIRYRTDFWHGRPLRSNLVTLCEHLGELVPWVRLHYVYPYPHVDDLIPLMADSRLLPYLDIPLQHASPPVLRAMRRPAAADRTLERIRQWREAVPELTLRSTFIVGFPGETDADFEVLLEFLREARLERVGCFAYSDVEGASANALPDHVPEDVKHERLETLMTLQAEISLAGQRARIGRTVDVLIDEAGENRGTGRTTGDAPEIDGVVYVDGAVTAGEWARVQVTDADTHDLFGKVVA